METAESPKERFKQRRDETIDRRQDDCRVEEQREGPRRVAERRQEFCPLCSTELTPTLFCSSCKVKVIKIRG